ncbi:hypothetical protein CONLIGDRAFT_685872 [Coniochaeta ligniaria NRRL 30616]|uniref:Uncharacterized protein n=1 Tax=Coniochaeta ligniaria NRRL 30616 TaxID=1408157 RepID=A0A1J7I9X5_9PEZI|nr:hypothetical protein CONLIGDRAFT_685872 [Coniochaeta ligniaria NRRL 30616]
MHRPEARITCQLMYMLRSSSSIRPFKSLAAYKTKSSFYLVDTAVEPYGHEAQHPVLADVVEGDDKMGDGEYEALGEGAGRLQESDVVTGDLNNVGSGNTSYVRHSPTTKTGPI